ncbi:hypothetical protein L2E82_42094 [Cichorium intybus]|uniref:Uncharacterized protein n=1 Tax=Cichorium intybus TaxID=13427 RepID=A0ACB8ZQV4_CICIN|nr:hypothetical protein L2E82_42094 [Cichorium intybus]
MDRFLFQPNALEDRQQQRPPIEEIISFPIILSDRIRHAVSESKSHKLECNDVGKKVHTLSEMLRSTVRFASSTPSFYEPPLRRIFTDIAINLNRTLTLVRKCRHRSIFRRFVTNIGIPDFRKLFNLLDMSIGDMNWLLSIFDRGGEGIVLSLPPIANNDPILAWVWSIIASLHLCSLNLKIEVAHELYSLAQDNDRNKNIIVEEGGISPLLKLLKEDSSPDAQIAAALALFNLANNQIRARLIFNEHGVPIIAHVFRNSPIMVQIEVAKLIATMAEHDTFSQEGFAREDLIRTLVTLMSFDNNLPLQTQLTLEFKTNCSGALWMLARGSITNSRKIIEAKGLLCLAKLIEGEKGEIQINCLMTLMEITAAVEYNPDLRRTAFKNNSPIVDQLLRLINQSDDPVIKIPAIRTIGHLARTFPARQTQVIGPLVKQLGHRNPDVGMESVIALGKFTCPENYLCAEHSKTIFEFEGVQPVLRLLRGNERTQYYALVLLCYLSMHAGNSERLQQTRLLIALEGANKSFACNYSELRELVAQATYHLKIAHSGLFLSQRQSYSR